MKVNEIQGKLEEALITHPQFLDDTENVSGVGPTNNQDYVGLLFHATNPNGQEHMQELRKENFRLIKTLFKEETKGLTINNFKLNCWKGAMFWGEKEDEDISKRWYGETSADIIKWVLEKRPWEWIGSVFNPSNFKSDFDDANACWQRFVKDWAEKAYTKLEFKDILLNTNNFIIEKDFDDLLKNTKKQLLDRPRKVPFPFVFINKSFFYTVGDEFKIPHTLLDIDGLFIIDDGVKYESSTNSFETFGGKPNLLINLNYNNKKWQLFIPQHGDKEVIKQALRSGVNEGVSMTSHYWDLLLYFCEKAQEYVCNLLDFVNHPEVINVAGEQHNRNDLRIKRGKIPLPSKYHVVLTGKLKKYVNETIANNEKAWELGHRFWVRGHWKHFESDKYVNKKGQKTWVLPYIKGTGDLVKKDYYVGEKEQCWENEKRMIQIVQTIFPDKKIQKHNRTILEGLEIDCYLPELKLGFEYNGKQHYEWVKHFHKTKEEFHAQIMRDSRKNQLAIKKGINIISIKYDEPLTEEHIKSKLK